MTPTEATTARIGRDTAEDEHQLRALTAALGAVELAMARGEPALEHTAEAVREILGLPQLDRDPEWIAPCPCGKPPRIAGDSFHGFRVLHSAYGHSVQGPTRETEELAIEAWNALVGGAP